MRGHVNYIKVKVAVMRIELFTKTKQQKLHEKKEKRKTKKTTSKFGNFKHCDSERKCTFAQWKKESMSL